MNVQKQKSVIKLVDSFIRKELGEVAEFDGYLFREGADAVNYDEYASKDSVWLAVDGSVLYDLLNYGGDGWKFQDRFDKFLTENNLWYEPNYAWSMNIMELS